MCRMCESDNHNALLELQAGYYCLNSTASALTNLQTSLMSPQPIRPIQPTNENSWEAYKDRKSSLSTCFSNLRLQRTQTPLPALPFPRQASAVHMINSNSPSPTQNLLSPPSSPKTSTLPLMRVVEVDEHESDRSVWGHGQEDGGELKNNAPCRRFQRQILSRLQVLGPQALEQQQKQHLDSGMLMVTDPSLPGRGLGTTQSGELHFTPPPSPDPYDQKKRRGSSTNFFRPLASSTPSSRKTSTSRPNKIRLPSLAELELGASPTSISPRFSSSLLTCGDGNDSGRRVSSPNPSSHLDSRGGIRKVGCRRKSSFEVLGGNTPFKTGWSFSTAYGRGK